MSIFEYNGSAVVAMVGKNCFAIACDRRLGVQLQTVATDFQRVFRIHDKLYIGLSGLITDVQTLHQRLQFRHKLYLLKEERNMKPETFANLVSSILYEKRMDGNKEEGSSSQDRQSIPIVHEVGESSGQAEKALQVVTAVTMFKQLMENPRFMEFIQSSSIAHQVQGSFGMPVQCLGVCRLLLL
ncbi:hypothetical protein L7F22_041863 [Adiantum nelumboides]|nr:hypothetical protein [Adiantum nelumboides]